MKTPAQVIDAKGADAIATVARVSIGAVRVWKHRNQFPRRVWPELTSAFPELTTERLRKIESEGQRERQAEREALRVAS